MCIRNESFFPLHITDIPEGIEMPIKMMFMTSKEPVTSEALCKTMLKHIHGAVHGTHANCHGVCVYE